MCMMLYMASDTELPMTQRWMAGMNLSIEPLPAGKAEMLRDKLSLRHRYYVGSSEGCGCAFGLALTDTGETVEDQSSPSRSELRTYLKSNMRSEAIIELYSCWDADETLPVALHVHLSLRDLTSSQWSFEQRQHVLLKRD